MVASRRVSRLRGSMRESVEAAIEVMSWLKPSDGGVVALALKYADEIDRAGDDQRAVGYLGQQLMGALRSLGGMPGERKLLDVEGGAGGRLAELRAKRRRRPAAGGGVDGVDDAEDLDAT